MSRLRCVDRCEGLEGILHQADMMQHRGMRGGAIAGQDRAHDGIVLLGGAAAGPPSGTGRGGTGRPGGAGPSRTPRAGRCARRHRSTNGRRHWRRNRHRGCRAAASPVIASCRACSRRRSTGVMLSAQSRAQVASISAMATNRLSTCSGVALETTAPLARAHVDQAAGRELPQRFATGVRETPCWCARLTSSRRIPA